MARNRTPLKNSSSIDHSDDSVTETNFGGEEGDDEGDEEEGDDDEMTEAERRKARGDGVDDDEEDEEEGEEEEEEEEEEDDDEEEEDDEGDDEEGDDEEEEEEEEGEEEEPLDAEALAAIAGKTPKNVPYARFHQVVTQNQQLIDALVSQRGGAAAPAKEKEEPEAPPFDFKAKGKEYREALLDGDEAKAEALEIEIDTAKAAKIKQELLESVRQERAQERAQAEAATVQQVIGKVMKDYPIFNDQSGDDFDQDALDEMLGLRDTYLRKGISMPEAIRKAADRVAQLNGLTVVGKVEKVGKTGKKSAKKPSVAGEDNRSVRDKRRALSNQRRTPPNLGRNGTGNRAVSSPDYGENGPSEAQIRRMSPKDKAAARGDFVPTGRKRK